MRFFSVSTSQAMRAAIVTSALIFYSGFDAAPPVSPRVQPMLVENFEKCRCVRKQRFGMRRKEMMELFGVGLTRMMQIERDAEVDTYLEGAARMGSVESVFIRQGALLILAYPLEGEAPKARTPAKRFKKRRR
jgi:hypothetical protein